MDVKDSAGRLQRLMRSLIIAIVAGALGYFIAHALANPEKELAEGLRSSSMYRASKAYQFVYYVTGLAFIVAFLVAMVVQKKLADRAYVKGLSPQARVHKS